MLAGLQLCFPIYMIPFSGDGQVFWNQVRDALGIRRQGTKNLGIADNNLLLRC